MVASSQQSGGGGGASGGGGGGGSASVGSGGNPASPSKASGIAENAIFNHLYGFDGLNYKSGPTQIGDQELLWCHNFHPIAPGNLKSLFDVSAATYNSLGRTIIGQPEFYTINNVSYMAVTFTNGSLVQVMVDSPFTETTILPAGSLGTAVDFTLWESRLLIIVSNVTNGYWAWNGTTLFSAGGVGPSATIQSGGSGYTTTPIITVLTAVGSGAAFTATLENGSVGRIAVTASGSGWLATGAATVPLLFSAVGSSSAWGEAFIEDGVLVNVTLTNGGSGYTSLPTVTVVDGGGGAGTGAVVIVDGVQGGIITSLKVVSGGSGYGILGSVTLSFAGGGGAGAAAITEIANGVITQVVIHNIGLGYGGLPSVDFIGSTGTGATGIPVLSGNTITDVTVTSGGQGYVAPTYVTFTTATGPASATVNIMPFGVNGISVASYLSRIWISRDAVSPIGPTILFTNVGDPADFGPPGGAFPLNQEFLRQRVVHLIPADSFLYLIGDSSVSYISGVQTTGSPAITVFTILNIDPQTGTPWHDAVYPFGQSVLMANTFGVHLITGGTIQKISDKIDGLFNSFLGPLNTLPPSIAVCNLNGVHVFGLFWPISDPTDGTLRWVILMSDGKRWWSYTPSVSLLAIFSREVDSNLTMWGHDGTRIYQLFSIPSTAIEKKLRTKLYTNPNFITGKTALAAYAMMQNTVNVSLFVKPVTELGLGTALSPGFATFTSGGLLSWHRSGAQATGFAMGWELSSTAANFTISELMFMTQAYTIRTP